MQNFQHFYSWLIIIDECVSRISDRYSESGETMTWKTAGFARLFWAIPKESVAARTFLCALIWVIKERVHSEMKISDKIKLDPNIMPFVLFFSKSVSIPSDINSGRKISLLGPALSLPGICIIASEDLHFLFKDLHYCFRTCIFLP